MIDPVLMSDGHSYERKSIITWLVKKRISPLTRERLNPLLMIPNHALRGAIESYNQ